MAYIKRPVIGINAPVLGDKLSVVFMYFEQLNYTLTRNELDGVLVNVIIS